MYFIILLLTLLPWHFPLTTKVFWKLRGSSTSWQQLPFAHKIKMKHFSFIVFIVLTAGVILPLTALISYTLNLKHFISIPASERNRGDCITSSLIGLRTICLLELPTDHLVSLKAPSTGRQREIEPNPRLLRTKSAGFYLIFPHLNTVCCIM